MIGSPSTGQSNIDYDLSVYSAKIAGLQACKMAIEAATSAITDKVVASASYWTGPAGVAVRLAYEILKERLKKLAQAIDNNITALQKVIGLMTAAETTNTQSGNTIKSAVESLSIS